MPVTTIYTPVRDVVRLPVDPYQQKNPTPVSARFRFSHSWRRVEPPAPALLQSQYAASSLTSWYVAVTTQHCP
jgi:hypothetical protein